MENRQKAFLANETLISAGFGAVASLILTLAGGFGYCVPLFTLC